MTSPGVKGQIFEISTFPDKCGRSSGTIINRKVRKQHWKALTMLFRRCFHGFELKSTIWPPEAKIAKMMLFVK